MSKSNTLISILNESNLLWFLQRIDRSKENCIKQKVWVNVK